MEVATKAETNFEKGLHQNPYPGRGLVVGRSSVDSAWLILYWIMGRSAESQNRRFVTDDNILKVELINGQDVANPSLLRYEAMLEMPGTYLVSNGEQTRTLYEVLQMGGTFDEAMAKCKHEPDHPNYTPRISGMLQLHNSSGTLTLSILKANIANIDATDRFTFRPAAPPPGFGVGLTTYAGDGDPLPSYCGDPLFLPCRGDTETLIETYWNALNPDYRVALAVKRIPTNGAMTEITIRNRF